MHKYDFKKLFCEVFPTSEEWTRWFFDSVVDENDLLGIESEGRTVSALMINSYPFVYQGTTLPSSYISCVATTRSQRGRGFMSELMHSALLASAERGDAFATLIPASRRLYFFYDKFGFSTVFYIDEKRYTSLHTFAAHDGYSEVEPDYSMFHRLEMRRACGIVHDELRYSQIVTDLQIDKGIIAAVSDGAGNEAMAFAEVGSEIHVLDLPASSPEAEEAVLGVLRAKAGEKPVIVMGHPAQVASVDTYGGAKLRSRAMLRIINVEKVLSALSGANPEIKNVIRIHDPIITDNNATFELHGGTCRRIDPDGRHIDLDVSIDVLARVLFSAPSVGDIFGIATRRPFMSLMLD